MSVLSLAFSPCPNDTFIFDALVHGKIDTEGQRFDYVMEDVETLNHLAMKGAKDMIKVSYHAWLYLRDQYTLLDSGSALGFGNGPLLIALKQYPVDRLKYLTVAIPGEYTSAHLLLKIALPDITNKKIMPFDRIEDAVLEGDADAGVIIHENRFTYMNKGLVRIMDLGEYWENLTHQPVPLGGIVVKTALGTEMIGRLNRLMRRSVEYALQHPDGAMDFVRGNAKEMSDGVMRKHIGLYVNDFTLDLGIEGKKSVQTLIEKYQEIIAR